MMNPFLHAPQQTFFTGSTLAVCRVNAASTATLSVRIGWENQDRTQSSRLVMTKESYGAVVGRA